VRTDGEQPGLGPRAVPARGRQPGRGEQRPDPVLARHPPPHQLLPARDQHAPLPRGRVRHRDRGQLPQRLQLGQPQRVVAVRLALQVLELPRLGRGVGHLHRVPGGDGPVVHPARVGARLDHHRARVRRQQAVQRARLGVQFAERVRPGAAVGNARHTLVPTQIERDNRVTHRKPPTGAGDYPPP
jgi:hypothetical protein